MVLDDANHTAGRPLPFFFWSYDCAERRHTHVEREDMIAKFWIEPGVALADGGGFSRSELRGIERIVLEHREELINGWDKSCGQVAR